MTTARKPIGRFYELQQEVAIPEDYVLTSKIKIRTPTRGQMKALRTAATDDDADRAFFGDQYDAVMQLFEARPEQEWVAFVADIHKYFFGSGANDVEGKSPESSE